MGRGDGDLDTVSLIDLTQTPFRTIETVGVGSSPEGLKFSPDGKILAVGIHDGSTKVPNSPFYTNMGSSFSSPSRQGTAQARRGADRPWSQGIAFAKDSHTILVENMVERGLSVFRWRMASSRPARCWHSAPVPPRSALRDRSGLERDEIWSNRRGAVLASQDVVFMIQESGWIWGPACNGTTLFTGSAGASGPGG